jgi:3-dehydroshikimate dehydratase
MMIKGKEIAAMIIPGLVSATFRDQTVEWILEKCKRANLKAIEWSENAHVFPDDEVRAAKLYEETRKAGLEIAAYGSYYRLGEQEHPETCFLKSLKSAVALKAPVIRIWAGAKPSIEVSEVERESMAREAALVAEMAEKYEIKVALEWHRNTMTDTNASALELLHKANHSNLYCLWQPTPALSIKERTEGIDLLGDRMLNLHIYFWDGDIRLPLEQGIDEWKEYLSHVDQSVSRYGLMEFVMGGTEEQLLEDAETLHGLVGDLN